MISRDGTVREAGFGIIPIIAGIAYSIATQPYDWFILPGVKTGIGIYNFGLPPKRQIKESSGVILPGYGMFVQPLAWPGEALAVALSVAAVTFSDTGESGVRSFVSGYNFTMPDGWKIKCIDDILQDPRHNLRKFGPQAWPGIAVGLPAGFVLGCLAVTVITSCNFVSDNFVFDAFQFWKDLSGPIMNVAIERPKFAGFSQARPSDTNTFSQSVAKATGYTLAVPTTALAGCLIYLARKLPDVFLLAAGIVLSPVTAIVKGGAYLIGQPRFPENVNTDNNIETTLRNIYSSLVHGRLPAGKAITSGDGSDHAWSFVRKCMTLNAKSPTEETLNALLAASKMQKLDSSLSKAYYDAIIALQKEYRDSWLLTNHKIESACQEVRDVSGFVSTCKTSGDMVPHDFYARRKTTWTGLFFEGNSKGKQPVRDEEITPTFSLVRAKE